MKRRATVCMLGLAVGCADPEPASNTSDVGVNDAVGDTGTGTTSDALPTDGGSGWVYQGPGPNGKFYLASIGDVLVAFGGMGEPSETHEFFGGSWKRNDVGATKPPNYTTFSSDVAGGVLAGGRARALLVGGRTGSPATCESRAWSYERSSGWTVADMPDANGFVGSRAAWIDVGLAVVVGGNKCSGGFRDDAWSWDTLAWKPASSTGCTNLIATGGGYKGGPIYREPGSITSVLMLAPTNDTYRWNPVSGCTLVKAGGAPFATSGWMTSDGARVFAQVQGKLYEWVDSTTGWKVVAANSPCGDGLGGGAISTRHVVMLCPDGTATKTYEWRG